MPELFSVNTIVGKTFYRAFEPVPDSLVFPALLQFEVKSAPGLNSLQRAIQRDLDEMNTLPPDLRAAVQDESERLQQNAIIKAKIIPKGAVYDAPLSEDLAAELEADGPPANYSPPVPEEDDGEEEEPPARQPKPKPVSGKPPAPGQRYVRRKNAWKRIDSVVPQVGERVYKRIGQAFARVGRFKPKKNNE